MAKTIYASFPDASHAEKAAGALLDHGVRAEDISLISNNPRGTWDRQDAVAHSATLEERRTALTDTDIDRENRLGENPLAGAEFHPITNPSMTAPSTYTGVVDPNMVPSPADLVTDDDIEATERAAKSGISTTIGGDAAAGAAKGAGIGLGIGAVAALASLIVPGVGLVVGGGALAVAIGAAAGATAAGAVAGGVYGYLVDQGVPETVATQYHETYLRGGAVLSVHVPSGDVDPSTVESLLAKYGAANMSTYGNYTA